MSPPPRPIGLSRGWMASGWAISMLTCHLVQRLKTVGMNLAVAGSLVSSLLVVHHDSGSREVQADCLCRMILMMLIFLLLWMMLIQIPGQVVVGRMQVIRQVPRPINHKTLLSVILSTC